MHVVIPSEENICWELGLEEIFEIHFCEYEQGMHYGETMDLSLMPQLEKISAHLFHEDDQEMSTSDGVAMEMGVDEDFLWIAMAEFLGELQPFMEITGIEEEAIPDHQLLQPHLEQINVAIHSEENPSEKELKTYVECPLVKQSSQRSATEKKEQKKKILGTRKLKQTKKRRKDEDDSWMPKGWVKVVKQRPMTGKFPGYEDKFYYAPGVARPFRSKAASLRYIETLKNATAASHDPFDQGVEALP